MPINYEYVTSIYESVNLTATPFANPDNDFKIIERKNLKQLISSGYSSELKMYSDGEKLMVKSFNIDNIRTLFILDGQKMYAPKKRTSHLKALLKKLAQQEGAELELVNQLPSGLENFRHIIYWPFKLEMDDSALLVAKPLAHTSNDDVLPSRPAADWERIVRFIDGVPH